MGLEVSLLYESAELELGRWVPTLWRKFLPTSLGQIGQVKIKYSE